MTWAEGNGVPPPPPNCTWLPLNGDTLATWAQRVGAEVCSCVGDAGAGQPQLLQPNDALLVAFLPDPRLPEEAVLEQVRAARRAAADHIKARAERYRSLAHELLGSNWAEVVSAMVEAPPDRQLRRATVRERAPYGQSGYSVGDVGQVCATQPNSICLRFASGARVWFPMECLTLEGDDPLDSYCQGLVQGRLPPDDLQMMALAELNAGRLAAVRVVEVASDGRIQDVWQVHLPTAQYTGAEEIVLVKRAVGSGWCYARALMRGAGAPPRAAPPAPVYPAPAPPTASSGGSAVWNPTSWQTAGAPTGGGLPPVPCSGCGGAAMPPPAAVPAVDPGVVVVVRSSDAELFLWGLTKVPSKWKVIVIGSAAPQLSPLLQSAGAVLLNADEAEARTLALALSFQGERVYAVSTGPSGWGANLGAVHAALRPASAPQKECPPPSPVDALQRHFAQLTADAGCAEAVAQPQWPDAHRQLAASGRWPGAAR